MILLTRQKFLLLKLYKANMRVWKFTVSLLIETKGKISAQPHPTLCIQFLNRENNDKNNTFPLGKQICFTIVWGFAETLPGYILLKCIWLSLHARKNWRELRAFTREIS